MQYVAIKKEIKNNKEIFVVNAIPLKNKNKSIVQKIPHPLGSDGMEFKTLEEAKDAITRAGFSYILPDGKKETKIPQKINKITYTENNYEELIYNAIKEKTNPCTTEVIKECLPNGQLKAFPWNKLHSVLLWIIPFFLPKAWNIWQLWWNDLWCRGPLPRWSPRGYSWPVW